MNKKSTMNVGEVWWFWFSTNAFHVDKQLRRLNRLLPHDPRCKFCNAPFQGVGGLLMRVLFSKQRSALNPNFCNLCEIASREFLGGAEVEMSMLFIDIRGSTAFSEKMSPTEFSRLIEQLYKTSARIINDEDGLVEKLAGDAVAAFWGAGFAGPAYIQRTVTVAERLLKAMAQHNIPVGIGVHSGVAFFGSIGAAGGLTNITAIGDEVNIAARLAAQAAPGEILVSEPALKGAGIDENAFEQRRLELKGVSEPVPVRVMHSV